MKKTFVLASLIAVSALMISCGSKSNNENTEVTSPIENVEAVEEAVVENPQMVAIDEYMAANNLTAEPNAEGLRIIIKEQGNGPKVEMGKKVKMHYTGKLLDGKVFDTSVKEVAESAGMYDPRRPYEPLEYIVGEMGLIKGWEQGVMGQAEGTKLQVVFPSDLGYGAQGVPGLIPANSPLTFEIEIVEVK